MEEFDNFLPLDLFKFEIDGKEFYNVQVHAGMEGLENAVDLFEKHGAYPNGSGWEGLITYILEQTSPELLGNIEFDGESDSLRMRCQSEEDMFSLAALLQPVILDESRLSEYLETLPEHYKFG
jgi:hypothetical protein